MGRKRYPTYKPSGVAWLGDVPKHWEYITLKWVSRRYSGGTPDKTVQEYWEEGTIPWLNSGAVNDGYIVSPSEYITEEALKNSSAKWIPKDALVMALAGQGKTKGMVAQLGIKTTCNQSMVAIIPDKRINPRLLFWWLTKNYANIRNLAGGDARDGLNLEMIGSIPCPLPPLEEQKAIADYLDRETAELDRLIEKKKKLIELLKEKRQALISQVVTRGLDPQVKLKPSGVEWLGDIPVHWEVKKLKYLGNICYGIGESVESVEDGIPLIRATNINSGKIESENLIKVNPKEIPSSRIVWLKNNDIIVVRSGAYTGDSSIITQEYTNSIAGYDMVLSCTSSDPKFIAYSLLSKYLKEGQIYLQKLRAAQPHINAEELGNCDIILPPLSEQPIIATYLDQETAKIDYLVGKIEQAIETLKEYRTALISSAVTGQIDVR